MKRKHGNRFKDLHQRQFGRWTVLSLSKGRLWRCQCSCGKISLVWSANLLNGTSKSCGCLRAELLTTHGLSKEKRYRQLYINALVRAKRKKLLFTLKPEDICIPSHCPVFNLPLCETNHKMKENSPSLDRKNPLLGYTKENCRIISWKANKAKSNLTIEQLQQLLDYARS